MFTQFAINRIILGLLMAKPGDGGAGNMARQMAAAPLAPAAIVEPAEGTKSAPALSEKNRFRAIFGRVVFKAAGAGGKVYGADREGDKLTKKLASVEIEIVKDSRFYCKGKVQAAQDKTGDGEAYPEFLFQASQFGGQSLHTDDPGCAADLQEFREYVLDLFDLWSATGANTTHAAAKRRTISGLSLK